MNRKRKCRFCNKEGEIFLRYANLRLCQEHFLTYFEKRVEKTLEKFKIKKEDKIAIAFSGGKDSVSLFHVLFKLGYNILPFFIDLGIPNFSENSKKVVIANCKKVGIDPLIISISEHYSYSIKELAERYRRNVCSICGLAKRYLMNKIAFEHRCNYLATAHNLDDEVAFGLKNIFDGNLLQIVRAGPYMKGNEKLRLVTKIKPLYKLNETETKMYCDINGFEYVKEKCPFSVGEKLKIFKEAINLLENNMPSAKLKFYNSLMKIKKHLSHTISQEEVKPCSLCKYPTTKETCLFCRIFKKT